MNEKLFDIVLEANAKYNKAVEEGASAAVQEALLDICDMLFRKLILSTGLVSEYSYYCDCKGLSKRENIDWA